MISMRSPLFLFCFAALAAAALAKPASLQIEATGTPELTLRGKDARQQLLVTAKLDDGAFRDFTHKASYQVSPAGIVNEMLSRMVRVPNRFVTLRNVTVKDITSPPSVFPDGATCSGDCAGR